MFIDMFSSPVFGLVSLFLISRVSPSWLATRDQRPFRRLYGPPPLIFSVSLVSLACFCFLLHTLTLCPFFHSASSFFVLRDACTLLVRMCFFCAVFSVSFFSCWTFLHASSVPPPSVTLPLALCFFSPGEFFFFISRCVASHSLFHQSLAGPPSSFFHVIPSPIPLSSCIFSVTLFAVFLVWDMSLFRLLPP